MTDLTTDQIELLGLLREAVVAVGTDGIVSYANPVAEALAGYEPGALSGRPLVELMPPRLREAHLQAFSRYMASGRPSLAGVAMKFPVRRADGSEQAVDVVLSPLTDNGTPGPVIGLLRPAGDSQDAEQMGEVVVELVSVLSQDLPVEEATTRLLRAIVERLEWDVANLWVPEESAAGEALRFAGSWHDPAIDVEPFITACRAVRFNRRVGHPGRVWATGVPTTIADLDQERHFLRSAAAKETKLRSAYAFPVQSGDEVVGVIELLRREVGEPPTPLLSVLAAIGSRVGPYLDRVRINERRVRSEARLRLINEADQLLARWLDYRTTLDDVASMLVPEIADACVVDLTEQGRLLRVGRAFAAPELDRAAAALEEHLPDDLLELGTRRVIEAGESVVYGQASDEELRAVAPDERALELLRTLRSRWTVIVPLVGRRDVLGALTLSRFESDRPFDRDDVAFAEELGRHLGLAMANARLYEREHAVASALQQSLLPPELPNVPGYDLAARFRPGGEGLAVGGDFYDLFPVDDDTWAAVVGDVCGTGAEAAAITSQVRYTVRSVLPFIGDPVEVLHAVNRSLLPRGDLRFCTALVACIKVEGEDHHPITLACAGHPFPMIVSDGQVRSIECRGTLLGVFEDASYSKVELDLARGESIVFFTDGVIEARDADGELLQEEGLEAALRGHGGSGASELADAAVRAAVEHAGGPVDDDIAVLVVRRG